MPNSNGYVTMHERSNHSRGPHRKLSCVTFAPTYSDVTFFAIVVRLRSCYLFPSLSWEATLSEFVQRVYRVLISRMLQYYVFF